MKVTYNWLKDFVDIKISPQELADKLTMAGLEVGSVEAIRGDFVFEVEITSNRPDWLSVIGIAREVAAVTGGKLKLPAVSLKQRAQKRGQVFSVEIEDKKDCPLYTAKIIKEAKVGPSPGWLRERLELVGCRSINNVVDITNYVLFELGEPLHAFDLDKLTPGAIIVRRARRGEKITAIDGVERILGPEILVIADKKIPVAIAGVMGGKDTEVTESTRNVLLEAAIFNPVIVRRGRQKLGLQSEAAYRFERGIDPGVIDKASLRSVGLIQQLAGGSFLLAKSSGVSVAKNKTISFAVPGAQKILGVDIPSVKMKKILNHLGFKVRIKGKNNLTVPVPSYRQDVKSEVDLIEEIARIYGYEHIPTSLPTMKPQIIASETRYLVSLAKDILVGLGLNEAITYSLIDKDSLNGFQKKEDYGCVEILNPLSKEQEILRPTLLPGLSRCVSHNLNQKQEHVNIFEIAKVFSGSSNEPREELTLGIALCGARSLLLGQGQVKDEFGFLHLKGMLETLFNRLGIKGCSFVAEEDQGVISLYIREEKIGSLIKLRPSVLDRLDIKNKNVFAAELSLDKLFLSADLNKKFTPPPRYPGISRDISFVLKENISIRDLFSAVVEKGRPLLREVKIIDYYKGKQIPAGYRGLTVSCLYRADERTLTEAEINPLHALVCAMLADRFSAKMR